MYTQAYMRIDVHANEDICAHKLWYLVPFIYVHIDIWFTFVFFCRCCTRQHRSFWGCVQLVRTRANGREHRSRKRSPNSVLDSNARSNDSHRWIRRLHVIFFVLDETCNTFCLFSVFNSLAYSIPPMLLLCCCFVCSAPGVGRKLIYASLIWRAETSISLKSLMWINSSWYSLVHVCRTIVYRLRFIFWKLAFFL